MCLIITGQSNKIRSTLLNTHGMLADIFSSNPDGIGIMYGSAKGLRVVKTLPKNLPDAQAFIRKLPTDDRDLAIHFRWTTHGHTDLSNCHPYDVTPGYIAMMHNGVLHTGNAKDTARSDTYHFIQDYLRDAVHEAPSLVHNEGFLTMVAEFIGDNRFVFMDGEGRMSHVNYDQGIEHDGLWFSNTYAWSPTKLIPNYYSSGKYTKRYASAYNKSYNAYLDGDYDDEMYGYRGHGSGLNTALTHTPKAHEAGYNESDYDWDDESGAVDSVAVTNALTVTNMSTMLFEADVESIEYLLEEVPMTTINFIMGQFTATPTRFTSEHDLTSYEGDIYRALIDGDVAAMHDFLRDGRSAGIVAEVMCYYLEWSRKVVADAEVRPLLPAML
jgi:predicted glutamine amidotransferase